MLAEAEGAVPASVSENALRRRLVELNEFGEQAATRRHPATLEGTPAVPQAEDRTAEKQPFAFKLDLWRGGPSRHRGPAVHTPFVVAETDEIPLVLFCHI
jgi:hypothetical protein